MNKTSVTDIASAIAQKYGIKQESAETFVADFFETINQGLNIDKIVKVRGLGTFKIVDVQERESINVNTGERVTIDGHSKINFTPDPIMRDLVNKPFSKFETVILNEGVDIDELNKLNESTDIDNDNIDTNANSDEIYENEEIALEDDSTPNNKEEIADDLNNVETEAETEINKEVESDEQNFSSNNVPEQEETDSINIEEETNLEPVGEILNASNVENPEPKEIHIITEPKVSADENTTDNDIDEDSTGEEEQGQANRNRILIHVISTLLLVIIAFACGYLVGQKMASRPIFKTVKVYKVSKPDTTTTNQPKTDSAKIDTTKTNAKLIKNNETSDITNKETVKTVKTAKTSENQPRQNETKTKTLTTAERQVRTGAYIITGTDRTITVKKGQTMKGLSKIYLGEGMECYIQVHNGIDELTEGMSVKIPKLKLKKH